MAVVAGEEACDRDHNQQQGEEGEEGGQGDALGQHAPVDLAEPFVNLQRGCRPAEPAGERAQDPVEHALRLPNAAGFRTSIGARRAPPWPAGRAVTSGVVGLDGKAGIDLTRLPAHVGCVMDGNGRWAQRRGLPRTEGHAAGEEALLDTVEGALELGIRWLTVYAFSTENWRRPPDEVRYLMGFNESLLQRRRDELHERGVRIRFAGRRDWRVPRRLLRHMDDAMATTERNRRMTLVIAFNYGGRAEIVDAVRRMVAEGVPASRVDERAIRSRLYLPDVPDPDLVIRTSGEFRISNFLLWELAYSELVFTDTLWPDFRREDLFDAVREYQSRDRRFGGVERVGHR
ncbi:MAG: di-trans,poly-cis-decaprenylcistransferase [Actinobacteria bacterium]|nr:MAG: di-trans,poly-cis-decaprenylcistransferase [Actinomycetota bacterium]